MGGDNPHKEAEQPGLLEQVRAKEAELKLLYEKAQDTAATIRDIAQKSADETLGEAERLGRDKSAELLMSEREKIRKEIEALRREGEVEAESLRETLRQNISEASGLILRRVKGTD